MDNGLPSSDWGLCPYIGPLPAYPLFVVLGLVSGLAVFFWLARRESDFGDHLPVVLIGAIVGGVVGAKLPYWISSSGSSSLLAGRTVLGGVVGGVVGVVLARRLIGLRKPMGNTFAPALALGVAIGRIGCLCGGCCNGIETHSSFGVDFGDHVMRWPTQIIESLFCFALFGYLLRRFSQKPEPGVLFREFMLAFFGFRFLIEFLRVNPVVAGNLTQAQWVAMGVVIAYGSEWIVSKAKQVGARNNMPYLEESNE